MAGMVEPETPARSKFQLPLVGDLTGQVLVEADMGASTDVFPVNCGSDVSIFGGTEVGVPKTKGDLLVDSGVVSVVNVTDGVPNNGEAEGAGLLFVKLIPLALLSSTFWAWAALRKSNFGASPLPNILGAGVVLLCC